MDKKNVNFKRMLENYGFNFCDLFLSIFIYTSNLKK